MKLSDLARAIHAELWPPDADGDRQVTGCASLDGACENDVTFLANQKYADRLATTKAAAVIVSTNVECNGRILLRTEDPYFAFRNATVQLHGFRKHPSVTAGPVSPQAAIDPDAQIGEGTQVHPFAVVSAGARIGKNCVLYPNTFVGPDVVIGDECQLFPGVTIYDRCTLGDRVTLHAGCVIGQDGFGYATHEGEHHKIPQTGNVIVGNDVEMGANCSVDRATVGSTIIGDGCKFSDSVTIGHGCKIGRYNLFVALVGVAGSVETGEYVALGGQVGVAGHLKIGHRVNVAATSGVMTDIPDGQTWGGTPAMPLNDAKRLHLYCTKLPDLVARIKQLEKQYKERNP